MPSSKGEEIKRTHFARQLTRELISSRVRIAGWVEDIRPLGSLLFLTVRDSTGISQVVFSRAHMAPSIFEEAKKVARQSAVVVEGIVKESRAKGMSVEVQAEKIHALSGTLHPLPLDPTGRVPASIDVRLDARPLDLRKPEVAAIFRIRHIVLQSIRRTLIEKGFIEVSTPKIISAGAEGGATLFQVDYFGRRAFLAQSPQLYKEQLTLSLDRVFEISDFYRSEKSHTRRHLSQFMSVDAEAAFLDEEDVMGIAEEVIVNATRDVIEKSPEELRFFRHRLRAPERPFERITYERAVKELKAADFRVEYGEDLTDYMLRILARRHQGYYFITKWPVKLKPFYIEREGETDLSRSFDLQHGNLEIASGGMRVSRREELERRILDSGLSLEGFSDHLRAFSWGLPPHAGWGLGLERLMMVLCNKKNIREVVLYPRDAERLAP